MITLGELLKIMDFTGTTLEAYEKVGKYVCSRIHAKNLSDYYDRKVVKVYFDAVTIDNYGGDRLEFYVYIIIE